MDPETLETIKILVKNLSDDGLAEYALIIALEVTRRGKLTPKRTHLSEDAEAFLMHQRPGGL